MDAKVILHAHICMVLFGQNSCAREYSRERVGLLPAARVPTHEHRYQSYASHRRANSPLC